MNFPSSLSDRLPRLLPPHRKLLYINMLDMGVCVQKIFVAGVASFPRAWQEGETVRPSETGPLRNDRGGTGKKRLQLRRLELSNECGHDIFKIRRKFQPALFMRVAGEDRAFVSESEICQRQGGGGGI